MEVHQHAHHEGKKNWKSYFWEFLMLFLAITLGFLVENQREHYIERIRAKDFSKTLGKDLQNDTMSRKTLETLYADTESLENKRPEIKELLNMIVVQQRNLRFSRDVLWKQAEELAAELINDLKKQYHFE